jgi:CHAD domain-containing protein
LLLAQIGRLQGDAPKQPGRAAASGLSVGSATQSGHTRLDQVASPLQRPLRERLAQRLNRWHRGVVADAQSFDLLDDEGRHRLRKHIKRLRYAVEFCTSLFDEAEVQSYLKGLRTLQERLGTLNDVAVGIALYSAAANHDTRALFALGWLAAQREAALAACRPNLKRFLKLPRFWRGKDRHKPGKPGKPVHKAP